LGLATVCFLFQHIFSGEIDVRPLRSGLLARADASVVGEQRTANPHVWLNGDFLKWRYPKLAGWFISWKSPI